MTQIQTQLMFSFMLCYSSFPLPVQKIVIWNLSTTTQTLEHTTFPSQIFIQTFFFYFDILPNDTKAMCIHRFPFKARIREQIEVYPSSHHNVHRSVFFFHFGRQKKIRTTIFISTHVTLYGDGTFFSIIVFNIFVACAVCK